MEVAVLGLGEAGGRIASDLVAAGCVVRGFDPARQPEGITNADERCEAPSRAPMSCSASTLLPSRSRSQRTWPARFGAGALYADLNTSAPELKRELAETLPVSVRRRRARRSRPGVGPRDARARLGRRGRAVRRALPTARHAGRGGRCAPGRRRRVEAPAQRLHEGHRGRRDREPCRRPRPRASSSACAPTSPRCSASRCSTGCSPAAARTPRGGSTRCRRPPPT